MPRIATLERPPPRRSPPSLPPPPRWHPPEPDRSGRDSARRRVRLRVSALVAALAIVVTLAFDAGPLVAVAFVFVVVVPFEKLFPRHDQPVRRPHLGTDIAYGLVSTPLTTIGLFVGVAVSLVSLLWIPGLLVRPLVLAIPAVPRVVLGIVLFDLVAYWAHRFAHEVPFLWRFHRIHHSTEHLDWVSGFRSHPFDGALLAPPFALLVVAGFDPQAAGVLVVLQITVGLFLHANVRWRFRPLQRIIATPEFHHWHHSNELEARNSNYAGLLPVQDLVFGTFHVPADRRPMIYGVDGPVSPGILGQLWDPFRGLRNPVRMLRHPIGALRELRRALRRGAGQLWSSARRPRRSSVAP